MLDLLVTIAQAKYTEKRSREYIAHLQERRFRELLQYVYTFSPWYRRFYRAHGIGETDLSTVPLASLPLVDKHMLMENFDEVVCDRKIRKDDIEQFIADTTTPRRQFLHRYRVIHTSGTTGKPGIYLYSEREWNIVKALAISRVSKTPINPFSRARLAFIGATGGRYAGVSLASDAPKFLFDTKLFSITAPIGETVLALNQFEPTSISGYASSTYLLALQQKSSALHIHPTRIICSGDMMLPHIRIGIESAFGVIPTNLYACSEALTMGADCDLTHRLHLFVDWHIFEILDENDKKALPEETGTLVLTNLYNRTLPLIRYRMDDRIAISSQVCSCGSPFPIISSIAGRTRDFFVFTFGERNETIHPAPFSELFEHGLLQYQVIQNSPHSIHIKVVAEETRERVMHSVIAQARTIFKKVNLDDVVSVTAEVVDEIPLDEKSHKHKLIIPLKQ